MFFAFLYSFFAEVVIYNPKEWFSLIFKFHKSDTFRRLFWVMLSLTAYSTIIAVVELEFLKLEGRSTTIMYQLLGFVISLLLVFRTNTAYDRWWEGRRLWGSLVNNCRNLALKIQVMLPETTEEKQRLMDLITCYPFVLKEHLRNRKVESIAPADVHQPNFVAEEMYRHLNNIYKRGLISGEQFIILDEHCREFTNITGACERIKRTPIPFSYSLFIKKVIFVYVMTMPFSFVTEYRYATIPIVVFVFYVLASLELIAEEIEDPFGTDANDLPTDELAATIEKNVKEIGIMNGGRVVP